MSTEWAGSHGSATASEAEATIEALLSGQIDRHIIRSRAGKAIRMTGGVEGTMASGRTAQAFPEGDKHSRFMIDLGKATRMLAAPEEIMAVMSRMLGEHLRASRCAYADVEKDGNQFTIRHDYTDGCLSTVGHYHLSLFGPRAVATLHSGQTLIVRSVDAELVPSEGADTFNAIGIKAIVTCPLVKDGSLRAMMAVHQTTPRDWTSAEVSVVQEVVERCWATIERGRAEAALRESTVQLVESEARFRQMTGAIREVFFLTDSHMTRIFYVSPAYETVFGRSCESLYLNPQSWGDPVHPDDRERTFATIAPGGTVVPFDVEYRILRPDGSERSLWARGYPVYGAAGEIDRFAGITEDITDRKQAEAAQAQREVELQESQRIARIGSWEWTVATGSVTWSEGMNHVLGRAHGLAAPSFEALAQFYTPQSWQRLGVVIARAIETGASYDLELEMVGADGVIRWTITRGEAIRGADGSVVKLRGTVHDITERHTLEVQFQQAQKMEAVGRLAGGVAHDFNNLLTVMLGFCDLLLTDLDPHDARQADIGEIQKAGLSAASLTRQLLAFSRKEIIEPTLLDLNAILTGMRPMLGRLIRENVRILLGLRPELAQVKADRGQVEQVVLNLAVNAQDAMAHGGTLTIETANVELDEHYAAMHFAVKPGAYVVLTVTDSGTGMTPDVQSRIFEPFFTTKEVGQGTGLGLATVHGIVTRNGGTVTVYSEVSRGTSFKVYFPQASPAETVADVPMAVVTSSAGTETVLVVEDAEPLRKLTIRLLERQGYTVVAAANAEGAIQLFEENPSIAVVLTDVVMPGPSGPELTKQLVQRRPGLKVIYMSGYTGESIVQHGVLKPGIAFLQKPFTLEALGRKIREVLDRPLTSGPTHMAH